MKVYIEYQFRNGPYGGANQFLKTLRDYFVRSGIYTERIEEADYVLINHTNISDQTLATKEKNPKPNLCASYGRSGVKTPPEIKI